MRYSELGVQRRHVTMVYLKNDSMYSHERASGDAPLLTMLVFGCDQVKLSVESNVVIGSVAVVLRSHWAELCLHACLLSSGGKEFYVIAFVVECMSENHNTPSC